MTPSLRGPVWMKITPQTGSSFHEKSHRWKYLVLPGQFSVAINKQGVYRIEYLHSMIGSDAFS